MRQLINHVLSILRFWFEVMHSKQKKTFQWLIECVMEFIVILSWSFILYEMCKWIIYLNYMQLKGQSIEDHSIVNLYFNIIMIKCHFIVNFDFATLLCNDLSNHRMSYSLSVIYSLFLFSIVLKLCDSFESLKWVLMLLSCDDN